MNYFEHMAGKGGKKEVALEVIEFNPDPGIEVQELSFEDTGQFRAYVERETGGVP